MKRYLFAITAVSLFYVPVSGAQAQDSEFQPILVGCLSSHERLVANIEFVGEVAFNPRFVDLLSTNIIGPITDSKGFMLHKIDGIDAKKPWGAAIVTNDIDVITLAFVPVTDVEQFLASMAPLFGEAVVEDDLHKIDIGKVLSLFRIFPIGIEDYILPEGDEVTAYVKEHDGFAFIATLPQHLDELPDVDALLGDLPDKFDLGVNLHVQNIPEVIRDQLVGALAGSGASSDSGDAMAQFRNQAAAWQGQLLSALMTESDLLTVGISLDHDTKQLVADVFATPLPDTDLASHVAELGEVKTRFGKLRASDGATITLGVTETLHPALAAEMSAWFESYRAAVTQTIESSEDVKSDEERQIFNELFNGISDALKPTFDSGRIDLGVRITGSDLPWTAVAGVAVEDTSGLQASFERAAELAKDDPYFRKVELDVEKVGDTRIHALHLRGGTPETEMLETAFGGMNFVVAFGPDSLWLAVGPEAVANLKSALGESETTVPPIQLSISGKALVTSFRTLSGASNPQIGFLLSMVATQLGNADLLSVSMEPGDGKLHLRATLESGYLKTAAAAGPILIGQIVQGRNRARAAAAAEAASSSE